MLGNCKTPRSAEFYSTDYSIEFSRKIYRTVCSIICWGGWHVL